MGMLAYGLVGPTAGQARAVGSWRPMSYGIIGAGTDGPQGLKWGPGLWAG